MRKADERTAPRGLQGAVDGVAYADRVPALARLGLLIVTLWCLWALAVRAFADLSQPPWDVASRSFLWVAPCLAYLVRVRQRPLLLPLGLGLPYGRRQLISVVLVPILVAVLLVFGTSQRLGIPAAELLSRLLDQARPRLVAPLFEELVFRGVLVSQGVTIARETSRDLPTLRRRFWAVQAACAALFTLVHWPWWLLSAGLEGALRASLPLMTTGLVLGLVFANTRSLWVCVFLHWLNNELSLLSP